MALRRSTLRHSAVAAFKVRVYSTPAQRSIPAAKQKYVPTSGTYPKGFLVGSSHAGVKASNTEYDDIALVVSEQPCVASAVFTRNLFQAAPVVLSKRTLLHHRGENIKGVVVNSGCANAVTGSAGYADAVEMGYAADGCFKPNTEEAETAATDKAVASGEKTSSNHGTMNALPHTLVMSTGVIGQRLPIGKIKPAIEKAHTALGSTHEDWLGAAQAICTTDTFPKLMSRTFRLPSHPTEYRIAGMTKGAGMIHPNMGTLLGIICTDVKLDPSTCLYILRRANDRSFNTISVDGDTSTNDTVALLANGAAAHEGVEPLKFPFPSGREKVDWTEDARIFANILRRFTTDLAKLVVRDGEGATKFVTVRVLSDISTAIARSVANSIATSSLVKTALYGRDANWGRILCAIGYAPGIMSTPWMASLSPQPERYDKKNAKAEPPITQRRVSVSFVPVDGEPLQLLLRGEPQDVDETRAKQILEEEDLEILVRLEDDTPRSPTGKRETHEARVWTCDLSHEYVTINGDYRT